jgi:hypothetical protein
MSFCDVDSVLNQVEEDEGWRLGKEIPRVAESTYSNSYNELMVLKYLERKNQHKNSKNRQN